MHLCDVQIVSILRNAAIVISVISVVPFHAIGWAGDPLENVDFPRLCGEFTIGKEGRLILLPVSVDGEEVLFMLDTGACRSGIDVSLRDKLGEPRIPALFDPLFLSRELAVERYQRQRRGSCHFVGSRGAKPGEND